MVSEVARRDGVDRDSSGGMMMSNYSYEESSSCDIMWSGASDRARGQLQKWRGSRRAPIQIYVGIQLIRDLSLSASKSESL